jgi:hypothetical protein
MGAKSDVGGDLGQSPDLNKRSSLAVLKSKGIVKSALQTTAARGLEPPPKLVFVNTVPSLAVTVNVADELFTAGLVELPPEPLDVYPLLEPLPVPTLPPLAPDTFVILALL